MEQVKKTILKLQTLELERIGDQTMGGEIQLEDVLEPGVEYTVVWDGITHKITCETVDGKQLLAYVPPIHGEFEPFEIAANGETAYVTCKSINPDVMIAVMEKVPDGGSGGVTSWNDLTDKPFYEEGGMVGVLAETTLTYSADDDAFVLPMFPVVVGETYIVNLNGTEYPCVAHDLSFVMGVEAYGMGNLGGCYINGFADTGEPFAIQIAPSYGLALLLKVDSELPDTLTLSIYHDETVVHTLDQKFLPDTVATKAYVDEMLGVIENGYY